MGLCGFLQPGQPLIDSIDVLLRALLQVSPGEAQVRFRIVAPTGELSQLSHVGLVGCQAVGGCRPRLLHRRGGLLGND